MNKCCSGLNPSPPNSTNCMRWNETKFLGVVERQVERRNGNRFDRADAPAICRVSVHNCLSGTEEKKRTLPASPLHWRTQIPLVQWVLLLEQDRMQLECNSICTKTRCRETSSLARVFGILATKRPLSKQAKGSVKWKATWVNGVHSAPTNFQVWCTTLHPKSTTTPIALSFWKFLACYKFTNKLAFKIWLNGNHNPQDHTFIVLLL
jgi:hypothetical protein